MKKILTVIGARPQFIKAAAVSRILRKKFNEFIVHTGQHYDNQMSRVFFDELQIPEPDCNLNVGSGLHGAQTGAMLSSLEKVIMDQSPDAVLIYGDTNSTLAGALCASKLHIPLVHVEAGLRSYDRKMPEEINRVVADHLSDFLFCPGKQAVTQLEKEGITRGVYVVGDVMYGALHWAASRAQQHHRLLDELDIGSGSYFLVTIHRAENTDSTKRLSSIFNALNELAESVPIVLPVHPRTRARLGAVSEKMSPSLHLIDPVGYLDMISLSRGAKAVLTDSGGLQKEAFWLGVPCVTLRESTEWIETVDAGWNHLAGAVSENIISAAMSAEAPSSHPDLYGDHMAAERCVNILEKCI